MAPSVFNGMAPTPTPFTVVQVGSLGVIGDNVYRMHEPAAAMARLPNVEVFEVHALARDWDAAALAADVLVLTMTMDVEVFRLVHQRRQLGKPTVCEVNDYLPDVQPWNPAHRSWADPRARRLFEELIRRCDATQVTTAALAQRLAPLAQRLAVFPNQIAQLPPPRQRSSNGELSDEARQVVVGWGGSIGHMEDLRAIAPALGRWLQGQPRARLEIMGDPALAAFFADVPRQQFRFHRAGPLPHYLAWLGSLDIGLAPLLTTEFNRCRSDVKFLEYAAAGVTPVLQRLDPYAGVCDGVTGFLFSDQEQLLSIMDQLIADPALRRQVADSAYKQVARQRRGDDHAARRIAFYRELQGGCRAAMEPLPAALQRAGTRPLHSLRGARQLAERLFRLDLSTPAERHLAAGMDALQIGALERAMGEFSAAVRLDPSDPHALTFLGHCQLRQGELLAAREAFEGAVALDPLLSRPVRALARLHRQAAEHYGRVAHGLNPFESSGSAP
ncbi:glycosyltransferase [Cyanobium sp. NIES-981]|uniref:glycosyltransferase family protein n=1 Tax=Cyanobium sp. NIES-981 TaxID=1851505 RepID=UPI001561AA24|nr:glycosyltransferase [Cyanobium sp. NIES-981]